MARLRNALRGLILWSKVGYPFLLFCLAVLLITYFMGSGWFYFWIALVLGLTLIVAEMLNHAIEELCDLINPNYSEDIKLIKDICAGAVLLSIVGLTAVGVWVLAR
jgi:diacylglycerol kinase (ATP)